jgi:hypothetical protein
MQLDRAHARYTAVREGRHDANADADADPDMLGIEVHFFWVAAARARAMVAWVAELMEHEGLTRLAANMGENFVDARNNLEHLEERLARPGETILGLGLRDGALTQAFHRRTGDVDTRHEYTLARAYADVRKAVTELLSTLEALAGE